MPLSSEADTRGPTLRVARLYHGSVVDGSGRRSVVQLQECPIRCRGCYVPQTHDPTGGVSLSIDEVVRGLVDPVDEPQDGVTVLGGEPFFQSAGLAALLKELKGRDLQTVVYSGYTLKELTRRPEPEVWEALHLIDLLVDGPFVPALDEGAGEWQGSRHQGLISHPARLLTGRDEGVSHHCSTLIETTTVVQGRGAPSVGLPLPSWAVFCFALMRAPLRPAELTRLCGRAQVIWRALKECPGTMRMASSCTARRPCCLAEASRSRWVSPSRPRREPAPGTRSDRYRVQTVIC